MRGGTPIRAQGVLFSFIGRWGLGVDGFLGVPPTGRPSFRPKDRLFEVSPTLGDLRDVTRGGPLRLG